MSVKEANKLKKLKALDLSKASTTFWAVKRKGAQPPFEYTVLRVNTPQALLFDAFYQGFGSAVPQLPALLPEVWLHWDPRTVRERGRDALLRFRMDFLLLLPQGIREPCHVTPSTPGTARRLSARNASRSRSTVTWCSSAVNFSFFRCLAAFRTRSSPGGTLARR